ncbi:DUF397 domain-containing protein [Kitasatospora sp. NPDC058063]|uniref:DUF397 domain-containing protein n=1 Tax=unclassified Kitasatospora TaxID=2633591 RepID=UPI0036D9E273
MGPAVRVGEPPGRGPTRQRPRRTPGRRRTVGARCRSRARAAPGRRSERPAGGAWPSGISFPASRRTSERKRAWHLNWQKSSYSSESANCIYLAVAPESGIKLRERDDPDTVLTTSPGALGAFLCGVRAGEFDHLTT